MNKMKSDNAHIKHLYNTIHIFFLWLYKLKDLICKINMFILYKYIRKLNNEVDVHLYNICDLMFSLYAKKKTKKALGYVVYIVS